MSVHLYIIQKFDSETKINCMFWGLQIISKTTGFSLEQNLVSSTLHFFLCPLPRLSVLPFRPIYPSIPLIFILPMFYYLSLSRSPPQDHLLANSCEKYLGPLSRGWVLSTKKQYSAEFWGDLSDGCLHRLAKYHQDIKQHPLHPSR